MQPCRLRCVVWVFTALMLLLPGVDRAVAQTPVFEWINPAGGSWNNPTNWSQGAVPGASDDVEFLLPGPLQVVTTGATAFDLLVQGSSTEIVAPACDGPRLLGLTILGTLTVDGNGSGIPGRFRLTDADCLASSIAGIDVARPDVGAAGINSLELAGGTELLGEELYVDPLACLRILLDGERDFAKSFLVIDQAAEIVGGLRLSSFRGSFPSIGSVVELIGTSPGNEVFLPEFGLIEAPIAVDVDLEFEKDPFTGFFDNRAFATIDAAELLLEVDVVQESDVSSSRIVEIEVMDIDSSGGSDFVYFRSNGVIEVILRVPGGEFQLGAMLFTAGDLVDGTAGDFNGDGTCDLAVVTSNGDDSGTLRLFFNAGGGQESDWSTGPTRLISGEPVSITRLDISGFLVDRRGVAVTSKEGGTRGVTRAVETSDDDTLETGEVEVGDDPGPSDPIDEENKKNPEGPIGVGGSADGLVGGSVFYVLRNTGAASGSLQVDRTIDLPGPAVDFASFQLDADNDIDTLVITENDALVLFEPMVFTNKPPSAVSIPEGAISIAIGTIDAFEPFPYVIIGFEDGSIRIYRIEYGENSFGFRIFLEEELRYDLQAGGVPHLALTEGFSPRRLIGAFETGSASQLKTLRIDQTNVPGCTQADIDGDGVVGAGDLGLFMISWGPCRGCDADLNGDGIVDGEDLALLISQWGPC